MKSFTGYVGKKDKEIRNIGKEFIIAILEEKEKMVVLSGVKELKELVWCEWCNVCAISEEEAKKKYDDAFLQWQKYNNSF